MKFAAAIVASFVTAVSANTPASTSSPVDARIIVQGLLHDATPKDHEIIQKSIVSAYNSAYSATGYSLGFFEKLTSLPIPDGVSSIQDCSPCVNDNSLAVSQGEVIFARVSQDCSPCGVFQDCSPCHEAFEETFCQQLRSSGSSNLAGAHGCSFSFLEMPGMSTKVAIKASNGETTEAQVMMHGALQELSETDLAIIDHSIMSAYNDAFAITGYSLSGFKSISNVNVPVGNLQDCSPCGDAATVVFAEALQDCSPCRNTMQDCSPCREAFEKAFCSKLQNSGSTNLAKAHSCSFRFVNNPVEGAESTQY